MNLSNLLSSVALLATAHTGNTVMRKARNIGWYAFAGLLLLTSYGLGTAALLIWLEAQIGLWGALVALAVAFAVLAGLVLLVAMVVIQANERHKEEAAKAQHDAFLSAVGAAQAGGGTFSMLTAAALGLAAGSLFKKP